MIKNHTIHHADLSGFIPLAQKAGQAIHHDYINGGNALLSDLINGESQKRILPLKQKARDFLGADGQTQNLILVGIGGSILSPNLFLAFANPPFQVIKLSAPNPRDLQQALHQLDPQKTKFLCLSKSGNTAETCALFFHICDWLQNHNIAPKDAMMVICANGDNPLKQASNHLNIPHIETPDAVNSRFSLFTPIGLFAACLFGFDIEKIRQGAQDYVVDFFNHITERKAHILFEMAAFTAWGQKSGKNIHAMLLTDPRLKALSLWWHQIFSESLGKNHKAMTPIYALLPEDLHIRFQLYLDGPDDKIFTHLTGFEPIEEKPTQVQNIASFDWLANKPLSHLILGQEKIAHTQLIKKNKPTRIIHIDRFDEHAYGGLLTFFILEILLIAHIWNIIAFGQPAIEYLKQDFLKFMRGDEGEK